MYWEAFLATTLKQHEENAASQSTSAPEQQTEMGSSSKLAEKIQLPRPKVTKVYKKGHRLVFSSHKEKGAKPYSSTKQTSTTKVKKIVEHELGIIDLEEEEDISIMKQTIRDKGGGWTSQDDSSLMCAGVESQFTFLGDEKL